MIKVRLKIGDGEIVDTTTFGFIYLDSDKKVGPATKEFESTSYPEEEGSHINPKTVDAAFEYTAKFFIQADSVTDANAKIKAFNDSLFTQGVDGVKTYKQVTFFNDYKRHKIVGYPKPIAEAEDFWRDPDNQVNDIVIIEWTIIVNKPSLCEWATPFTEDQTT